MTNKFLKYLCGAGIILASSACYKNVSLNGAGTEIVMFPTSTVINSYPIAAGAQTFSIVEVRRNVPNNGTLKSSEVVTIALDTTVITAYNTANGSSYTSLPSSVFTWDAGNPVSGSSITLTFAPDEFIKSIKISLDLSKLPPSPVRSALGFKITSVSAGKVSTSNTAFVSIGAKNAYEASYSVTGFFFHPTVASGRAISSTKAMTTLSPTRVQAAHSDLAGYYLQFDVASDNTLINYAAAGSTPPVPASGFMTKDNPGNIDFSGYAGTAGPPGTAPYVATTYNNTYNPSTKTFWMHYGYQSGGNGEATFTRQIYEKWVRQ